jgi:hypothetical protein
MSDRKNPVGEELLAATMERIAALSPAYLSEYVVPKLPAWEARATLTFAVIAATRRAAQGQASWTAAESWRLTQALRDCAPALYAVLTMLMLELEEDPPA